MRARFDHAWENLRASLWFVPAILVVVAVVVAFMLTRVDRWLYARDLPLALGLFPGTADAAQVLLGVVAGSLITAISIAFSVTIVALQQMAAQFTPRVLRLFTADRGNQFVLGVFIGTIIYALLVMTQVRSPEDGPSYVPALSVTVAIVLALVCLALLIYFIHHISQLLQVSVFMDFVHDELIDEVDRLFPGDSDPLPGPLDPVVENPARQADAPVAVLLHVGESGYLRSVDLGSLVAAADGVVSWLYVRPQVGRYLPTGCVLAEYPPEVELTERQVALIRQAFVVDTERTMYQDPLFGVRQLVDIALKALSPAINDPTTAEYSLSHLGDVLAQLAQRPFPSNERLGPGGNTRYIFNLPAWDEFVDAAFSQIRRQACDNVHVTQYLLHVLYELALRVPPGPRVDALRWQVEEVRHVLASARFSPADTALLANQCARVEQALQRAFPASLILEV